MSPLDVQARIHDAAVWCRSRLQSGAPAVSLRTPELRPLDLIMLGARIPGTPESEIHRRRVEIVDALCERRRALLGSSHLVDASAGQPRGRLLTFDLDYSFFDGVPMAETAGFFDADDLPPWDTWIDYVQQGHFLLRSWVPEELIDLVQRGVTVHMTDAYAWLTPSL